jgi:hypothetical protein
MGLEAIGILVTAGLTLAVTGVLIAGWRHRALIWGLIALGGMLILIVPLSFMPQWPAGLTRWLSELGTPSSWFALVILILAIVLFFPVIRSKPKERRVFLPISESGVPHISTPELRSELEAQIERNDLNVKSALQALKADIAMLAERTALPSNMGNTLVEVLRTAEEVSLSQIRHIRDTVEPLIADANRADIDIATLLHWAWTRIEAALVIPDLFKTKPRYDIMLPPSEHADRVKLLSKMRAWRSDVVSVLRYLPMESTIESISSDAERQADALLKKMKPEERPANVDVLEFREFFISAVVCDTFLGVLDEQEKQIKDDTLPALSNLRRKYSERTKAPS